MNFRYALHPKDYAIGQIEKFYTDMAAKGWHLKKHGLWFSKFVQGQPADMKYRVELLQQSGEPFEVLTMSDEQKAVFEDCGWEYVDGQGYISVFRAPADSDTEEFYIDPAQHAETLKVLKKSLYGNLIYWPVYIAIYFLLNMMTGKNMPAELHLLWLETPQAILGVLAVILGFAIESIHGVYHISRLYKQMKKGIPLDHSPKNIGKLSTIATFSFIVIGFMALYSPITRKGTSVPVVSDGGYVTLAELGFEIPSGNRSWLHSSGLGHRKSIFREYWNFSEDIEKAEKETLVWLSQDVYKLKSKDKAMKTAKALMNTSTFARYEGNFKEMDFNGLEKVYYNDDLEIVVINNGYVGYFRSIFTEETRTALLAKLAEKWI